MTGKTAIVTGASRGLGSAVVKMLLQCDAQVVIGIFYKKNLILN